MGTPITRRRAYGPMRKVDDQNTKPEQKKETKKPKQDPLFGKDAKGNPKITKKGSKKLEQGLDA